MAKTIVGRK